MKAPPLKNKGIYVRLTPEQFKMIEQRAERCGVRMGPWMRAVILQVAKKNGAPGIVPVREPEGSLG